MARYKTISTDPKLLAVDLSRQLLPGTIEHAVNYLLDHAVDLSRVRRTHDREQDAIALRDVARQVGRQEVGALRGAAPHPQAGDAVRLGVRHT